MFIRVIIDYARIDEFTGTHKNVASICVLGYSDDVYPLLTPKLADIPNLAYNPIGRMRIYREKLNATGAVIGRVQEEQTVWIKPQAQGNTEMTRAFEEAEIVTKSWLNAPPEYISDQLGMQRPRNKCFPPIVINISDAKHNGEGDPELVAARISAMRTENGNVLICNCYFTHEGVKSCIFPKDIREVEDLHKSKMVRLMFNMSSVIPEPLRRKGKSIMRKPIEQGARLFMCNANPDILMKMLRWGSVGNLGYNS